MITGTYKAELTINFHVDEKEVPNIRDFAEIQKSLADGDLNTQILELLRDDLDFDEKYTTITLTQKTAEMRKNDEVSPELEAKIADLEADAEPCAKLGISRADTATPCIGYAENERTNEMCEMCRDCKSSAGYQSKDILDDVEAVQRAIRHFQCMANDAQVVLDSGFGTQPGESNLVYRNRKLYAELAIAALEKQIPLMPVRDGSLYRCQHCHTLTMQGSIRQKEKCCENCGGKLNWDEEGDRK